MYQAVKSADPLHKDLFRQMVTIRTVEETLLRLFSQGLLRGTVHTCLGQEACAVGVVSALDKSRDILCSNHRGHGHFLAYCNEIEGFLAELMGKPSGICGGIGGSQHLQFGNFYSNGILGGMAPVTTGMALAEKVHRTGAVAVMFLGDGAMAEGIVYEAFNIASLWQLPILFAVEHNGYAQSTPTCLEHAGSLSMRGIPFDIQTTDIDGNDVVDVYYAARRIMQAVRQEQRPHILFMRTYRLGPHSKGDDFRAPAEIAERRLNDPLRLARECLDADWCDAVEAEIQAQIAEIVTRVQQAPAPRTLERIAA